MSSGITLSAGVRQNLLSLQNTASLMSTTQNRLATGKKVNTALDNPSNFFTSQSLSDRAGDLNSLLDSIGQATKTLDAANNGITSLTKMVQAAKSSAQQARQATSAVSNYSTVGSSANILSSANLNGSESIGTTTGTNTQAAGNLLEATALNITSSGAAITETAATTTSTVNIADPAAIGLTGATITETTASAVATTAAADATIGALNGGTGLSSGTLRISITSRNGTAANFDVALNGEDNQAAITTTMNATTATVNGAAGTRLDSLVNVTWAANKLTITAKNSGVDFQIQNVAGGSSATTLTELGLTGAEVGAFNNSSSLFDQLSANDASLATKTLTIGGTSANGTAFSTQTIAFNTGANGGVNTLAELNTALGNAAAASSGAFTASVTAGAITINKAAGTKASVTVGGTASAVAANAAILEGNTAGTLFSTHNSQQTASDLGLTSGGTLSISVNGATATNVTVAAGDRIDDVIANLNGSALGTSLTFSKVSSGGNNTIKIDAKDVSKDFTISANATSAAFGLTTSASADNVKTSSSLFNQLKTQGSVQGDTLVLSGTDSGGNAFSQTITFGTGANQVKTLSDLSSKLASAVTGANGAFSAALSGGKLTFTQPAGAKSSLTVGGTVATSDNSKTLLGTNLFGTHNSAATLSDLGKSLAAANGGPVDLASGGSLSFTVNNTNYTVGLTATDRVDDVVSKLSSSALAANLTFSKSTDGSGHDHIKVDAKNSSVDFTINANGASAALGLTDTASLSKVKNSTSLLDLLDGNTAGSGQGKTLTIAANGGATQTITFGTGTNQVQTLDQLNTKLGELSGVTASVSNTGALSVNVAAGTSATSLTIGGTAATQLGLTAGTQSGTVISTTASTTRSNLQNDFNDVLDQIDALAKDASYNGINLLNGDDLKVTFNENGSSSLTIKGGKFDSSNLGLTKQKGTQFQDNSQIDTVIGQIDTALSTLRSQSSKFGSNLSTVQTRQEFTSNMINTLQTGSDSLVLADSNEEGANMLALQTRQQLSTTALSLANQANQAVLRLF